MHRSESRHPLCPSDQFARQRCITTCPCRPLPCTVFAGDDAPARRRRGVGRLRSGPVRGAGVVAGRLIAGARVEAAERHASVSTRALPSEVSAIPAGVPPCAIAHRIRIDLKNPAIKGKFSSVWFLLAVTSRISRPSRGTLPPNSIRRKETSSVTGGVRQRCRRDTRKALSRDTGAGRPTLCPFVSRVPAGFPARRCRARPGGSGSWRPPS